MKTDDGSVTENGENDGRAKAQARPRYEFGMKAAQHIGASLGGSKAERDDAEAQAVKRMHEASKPLDWQAKLEGMSLDERVDATVECLGRRASFSRVLRAVMLHCRQARPSEEVEAFIEEQPDFAPNRQSARRYLIMLMRTGAIEETGTDSEGATVIVNEKPLVAKDEQADGLEQADGPDASERPQGQPQERSVQLEAGQAQRPSGKDGADADAAAPASDEPADPFDRVVAWTVSLTEAGARSLERTDPLARLRELVSSQPQARKDVYLDVLAFCEEPRTLAAITDHLAGSPGLETDQWGVAHMEPSAYIGKLDQAGGLMWANGWVTTQGGEQLLEETA